MSDGFEVQTQPPGLDLGIIVQVGDQRGHALGIGADGVEEVGLHLVDRADRAAGQQLGIALDGGHGVLQLVRHQRDKVALGEVGALHFAVELGIGDGDGGMVAQAAEEGQIGIGCRRSFRG